LEHPHELVWPEDILVILNTLLVRCLGGKIAEVVTLPTYIFRRELINVILNIEDIYNIYIINNVQMSELSYTNI